MRKERSGERGRERVAKRSWKKEKGRKKRNNTGGEITGRMEEDKKE